MKKKNNNTDRTLGAMSHTIPQLKAVGYGFCRQCTLNYGFTLVGPMVFAQKHVSIESQIWSIRRLM